MSGATGAIQDAVAKYITTYAFALFPLKAHTKNPNRARWQNERHKSADAFARAGGIGLQTGAASRGVVNVDVDCSEPLIVARLLLPPTDARFGHRPAKPDSQRLYNTPGTATAQFKDIDGRVLLQLGAGGCQTVIPPGFHGRPRS